MPKYKMDSEKLRYTLRIDRDLFDKFRYVADYNGRSANREIEQFILASVQAFELAHGEISTNDG